MRVVTIIIVSLVVAMSGAIGTALCRCVDDAVAGEWGLSGACSPRIPAGAGDGQAGCACPQTGCGCDGSADLPVMQTNRRHAAPDGTDALPAIAPVVISAAPASSALDGLSSTSSPPSLSYFALIALRTVELHI